ncbi:MAG: pyridoxamine 5'-phosphate oxidase [Deltaproteobacteria bacterium]|nr:MAG: pyridoxamine 5'-phosphate oxidase [Deltaproteobacteria bacterium]
MTQESYLTKEQLDPNPIQQFAAWFEEAKASEIDVPEGMVVASATPDGVPSARMVLCKAFDDDGFVFYTNYESEKAQQLDSNPQVSLLFHWKSLERQVRVVGTVERTDQATSDAYFQSRPRGSRISAWASPQSQIVADRDALVQLRQEVEERFGDGEIPTPPFWGGYRVKPATIEFWQGRTNRYHDRFVYRRDANSAEWQIDRLAP